MFFTILISSPSSYVVIRISTNGIYCFFFRTTAYINIKVFFSYIIMSTLLRLSFLINKMQESKKNTSLLPTWWIDYNSAQIVCFWQFGQNVWSFSRHLIQINFMHWSQSPPFAGCWQRSQMISGFPSESIKKRWLPPFLSFRFSKSCLNRFWI